MNEAIARIVERKQRQSRGVPAAIDWDDRRNKYVAAVAVLFGQVREALADPIAAGAVTVLMRPRQLVESYLGSYAIDDMLLQIVDEQVLFSPVGRNIVGAAGRVDVVGDRATATLILQPSGRWGVVESREPTFRIAPFDAAALAEVLKLVMRD